MCVCVCGNISACRSATPDPCPGPTGEEGGGRWEKQEWNFNKRRGFCLFFNGRLLRILNPSYPNIYTGRVDASSSTAVCFRPLTLPILCNSFLPHVTPHIHNRELIRSRKPSTGKGGAAEVMPRVVALNRPYYVIAGFPLHAEQCNSRFRDAWRRAVRE